MKIANEARTRHAMLKLATHLGCPMELKQIFDKYDKLLKNCSNETESKHIKQLALSDINNLLDVYYKLNYQIDHKDKE